MPRVLIAALVAFAPTTAIAADHYFNARYGLAFGLPARADVCRSPAPLPDHGLLFRPAGVTSPPCDDDVEDGPRYTSADARFDVDVATTAANFVDTECPQMAYDSQGRVTGIASPVHFSGTASAACRIDGADGSVLEIVFAQRRATPRLPTIDYRFVLKTTRQDYVADHAAFVGWLATVRIGSPA